MEPFEIMISESQERMLCVVEPERVDEVLAVCARWEVNATAIGEVTDTRRLRVLDGDERGRRHAGDRARRRVPGLRARARAAGDPALPGAAAVLADEADAGRDAARAARLAPTSPRAGWAFEQYDCLVGSRTVRRPEQADAAVLCSTRRRRRRGPRSRSSIDGNGRRVAVDPYRGAVEAVLECSANLACVGRRAARADQLPELRQPREAAHRVAAHARGRRPGRRVPRARRARSSAATSRSTTRAAAGRSSRRRSSAWSASCPTRRAPAGWASRSRATRSR